MTTTESAAIPTLREALMAIRSKAYSAAVSSQSISEIFTLADDAINSSAATPALPVPTQPLATIDAPEGLVKAAADFLNSANALTVDTDATTTAALTAFDRTRSRLQKAIVAEAGRMALPVPALTDERIVELYRESFNAMVGRMREAPKHVPDTVLAFARAIEAESRATIAAPASATVGDELHFNAQRLRNVAKLVGLESAVPQDDATLDGARGAVLGQIAAKLRKGKPDVAAAVNRFLAWPLPESLAASEFPAVDRPIGTHLMNADEAKAMFEYVLGVAEQSTDKPAGGA